MRDVLTRLTFACFATTVTVAAWPAPAEAQRWADSTRFCVREFDGGMDCSYMTLEQCLRAVSATGSDCAVNPRYAGDPAPRYRKPPPRVVR